MYLGLSGIAMTITITGLVFLFIIYTPESDLALFFLIITTFSILLLTCLGGTVQRTYLYYPWTSPSHDYVFFWSVSEKIGAGLLPPAAVSLYLVYLCSQTLLKLPSEQRHLLSLSSSSTSTISIPSTIIAALTLSWTSWRTSQNSSALFRLDMKANDQHDVIYIYIEANIRSTDIETISSVNVHCYKLKRIS